MRVYCRAFSLIFLFIVFLLTACQREKSYNHFLLHPHDLEDTYDYCAQLSGPEAFNKPECVAAINAAQTLKSLFVTLVNNRQQFGQSLLDTQIDLSKTQSDIIKAQTELEALKKSSASTEVLKNKQQQISQLSEFAHRQEFKIKMMWGVLRLLQPQFGG